LEEKRAIPPGSTKEASAAGETQAPVRQASVSADPGLAWLQENWGRLLQAIRPKSRQVEALLKSCEPLKMQGDVVTLGFYHGFHRERLNDEHNRRIVEEALSGLAGRPCRLESKLYDGNRQEREKETESSRREELLRNPVVREAIDQLGATVVDVQ
jgi:hypothetical protein